MKAILLAATLVAVPFSAHADSAVTGACKSVGKYARQVMQARQDNVAMSTFMDVIDQAKSDDQGSLDAARKIVIMAYEEPGFAVEANRKKAVESFGNEAELACYKRLG